MSQHFYAPEELDHALMGMKSHQRRDMLLHIDEILAVLDAASPAGEKWRAARKRIQLGGGNNPRSPCQATATA